MRYTIEDAYEAGWKDNAQAFTDWMNSVDQYVMSLTGMSVFDLHDLPFADAFMDEVDPIDFASEVLGNLFEEFME
jgi:hypothetical protein